MKERVILCDFDGTVIESNIEDKFVSYLLKQKEIRYKLLLVAFFTFPLNMILNKLYLSSITKSWTFILKDRTEEYIARFLDDHIQEIKAKNDTIKLLKSIKYNKLIILTGSYQQLVELYLARVNFIHVNKVIGTKVSKNRLFVKQHPFGKSKCSFVDINNYNIGVANDFSDHYYLDMCNEQYIIK